MGMGTGRIEALRAAVANFYTTVENATSDSAQVRYGIVPYASNVNVGGSIPSQYLASSAPYQSRKPIITIDWELVSTQLNHYSRPGEETGSGKAVLGSSEYKSKDWCDGQLPPPLSDPTYVGPLSNPEIVDSDVDGLVRTSVVKGRGGMQQATPYIEYQEAYTTGKGKKQTYHPSQCEWGYKGVRFDADVEVTTIEHGEKTAQGFEYFKRTFDLTALKNGGVDKSVNLDTGWNNYRRSEWEDHKWKGCIEEAATVPSEVWNPVPEGAHDLNINLIPTTEEQRWKPWLPTAVWRRQGLDRRGQADGRPSFEKISTARLDDNQPRADSGSYAASCPKAAMKLTADLTEGQLNSYLSANNNFVPDGYTYHDIGMIWGARFISPRGIFKAENESAPNGDSIARHIIFMTDGELNTQPTAVYGAYGIEYWDRRVTSDGEKRSSDTRVEARFQAACRQAREENISVWVIAFGTDLTENLTNCATPGRSFKATNPDQLNEKFQEIAQKIAALRLTS
ncbi:MAG: hypothetical protein GX573_17910, partial [Chloroflexi bacterium]|nr:hypothetical protein [Chloroflexota bacterium]